MTCRLPSVATLLLIGLIVPNTARADVIYLHEEFAKAVVNVAFSDLDGTPQNLQQEVRSRRNGKGRINPITAEVDGPDLSASASAGRLTNGLEVKANQTNGGCANAWTRCKSFTGVDVRMKFLVSGTDSVFTAGAHDYQSSSVYKFLFTDETTNRVIARYTGRPNSARTFYSLLDGHLYTMYASVYQWGLGERESTFDASFTSRSGAADPDLAPAPVPEPMTMLLFGSGVAAIAAKRYRTRRASSPDGTV